MLALSYLKILPIKSTLKGLSDKNEILILKCGFSILFIMINIMLVIEKNKWWVYMGRRKQVDKEAERRGVSRLGRYQVEPG